MFFRKVRQSKHALRSYFRLRHLAQIIKTSIPSVRERLANDLKKSEILIEGHQPPGNQIILAIWLQLMKSKNPYVAIQFSVSSLKPLHKIRNQKAHHLSLLGFFCESLIVCDNQVSKGLRTSLQEGLESFGKITTSQELENFHFQNIHIGDLIYDTYLRTSNKHTIDFLDSHLVEVAKAAMCQLIFWKQYLLHHHVKYVLVSHCVYNLAIPLRVALTQKIECFQITDCQIHRMTIERPRAYTHFKDAKKRFALLSAQQKTAALNQAAQSLAQKLEGILSVNQAYTTESAWHSSEKIKIAPDDVHDLNLANREINILVALHDFADSPHSYGFNFYPDFYEWLTALGEISKKSNFNWFLKTHPDVVFDPSEILREFIERYPRFTLVPQNVSHHELIKRGINVVTTCYGTVGSEYPFLGIPVVCASSNNPYEDFSFCVTPNNRVDYERFMLALPNLTVTIRVNEIMQWYWSMFLSTKSLIREDYGAYLRRVGGYPGSMTERAYWDFLEHDPGGECLRIAARLDSFMESNEHSELPTWLNCEP